VPRALPWYAKCSLDSTYGRRSSVRVIAHGRRCGERAELKDTDVTVPCAHDVAIAAHHGRRRMAEPGSGEKANR
jgi:hypothetical protein